jgi:hypothetical protein
LGATDRETSPCPTQTSTARCPHLLPLRRQLCHPTSRTFRKTRAPSCTRPLTRPPTWLRAQRRSRSHRKTTTGMTPREPYGNWNSRGRSDNPYALAGTGTPMRSLRPNQSRARRCCRNPRQAPFSRAFWPRVAEGRQAPTSSGDSISCDRYTAISPCASPINAA